MSSPSILALNSGASTLKFALYESAEETRTPLARGCIERIGTEGGRIWMRTIGERFALERSQSFADRQAAVRAVFDSLVEAQLDRPRAVGHRLGHGGPTSRPQRIDAELLQSLRDLVPLSPLRLPDELSCIDSVSSYDPDLPQVACFDTAFFSKLPEITRRFPFPASFYERPEQRCGFHGLSYESIVVARGIGRSGLTIVAHLGHGISMVALREGHPVDVHHEAGLIGNGAATSEMRVILERRARDEQAALAFEMFCYQTKKAIGALVAALGGIDNLLFTGGIGEHAAPVRERICASLEPIGIRLDDARNRRPTPDVVSLHHSRCQVRVVEADEELIIARHSRRILRDALETRESA
jgi:acetate kinase